jgi:cell division protein FtsW
VRLGRSHETLVLVVSVGILCITGLLMIYSATMVTAGRNAHYGNDAAFFLKRQVLFLVVGTCLAFYLSRKDYYRIREWIWPIMAVTFLLLLLVFAPGVSHAVNGA